MPSACFIHEEQQRGTETASDGPETPLWSDGVPSCRLQVRHRSWVYTVWIGEWFCSGLWTAGLGSAFCFLSFLHSFLITALVQGRGLFWIPLCLQFLILTHQKADETLMSQSKALEEKSTSTINSYTLQ